MRNGFRGCAGSCLRLRGIFKGKGDICNIVRQLQSDPSFRSLRIFYIRKRLNRRVTSSVLKARSKAIISIPEAYLTEKIVKYTKFDHLSLYQASKKKWKLLL